MTNIWLYHYESTWIKLKKTRSNSNESFGFYRRPKAKIMRGRTAGSKYAEIKYISSQLFNTDFSRGKSIVLTPCCFVGPKQVPAGLCVWGIRFQAKTRRDRWPVGWIPEGNISPQLLDLGTVGSDTVRLLYLMWKCQIQSSFYSLWALGRGPSGSDLSNCFIFGQQSDRTFSENPKIDTIQNTFIVLPMP